MTDVSRVVDALAGRYRIERELGAGGMATVYLARDLKHDRDVAIKVLRPELAAVLGAERFLAEVRITAGLDHPHILTLIDSGESGGLPYYVIPFVRGESLRARLDRERQLSIDDAVRIARQLASALDYAHRQGVVHRDIKPENILLHEDEAVLADFGIALAVKEAGNRLTETGLSLGTPQYMSPEQASGDRHLDARSDIYSLGAVFYEMLAGEPPTTGSSVQAIIAKLMTERPTRLRVVRDTVPAAIDAAVDKALAKVPADRFSSAGAFGAALGAGAAPHPRRNSSALTVGLAGAGIIVLAALSALALSRRPPPPAHISPTDARQLTFTGNVEQPAISADGKQLAYFQRACVDGSCAYSVEVQDIGSIVPRRILENVTYPYSLTWSPDRRNLVVWATLAGHFGAYLFSASSGATRFVMPTGAVDFFAGGDSLIVGPAFRPDTAFFVRVMSLDGIVGDSIRIAGPGIGIGPIAAVPHSRWIAAMIWVRPEAVLGQ